MTIRRIQLRLDGLPEIQRSAFLAGAVERLQQQLAERFPAAEGYQHTCAWETAPCVDKQKATPALLANCRQASVSVSRGSRWGISLRVKPEQVNSRTAKVLIQQAMPALVRVQGFILGVAGAIGLAVGLIAAGVHVWQTHTVKPSLGVGLVLGGCAAVAIGGAGLLLLLPLRTWAGREMHAQIEAADQLFLELWRGLQGAGGNLGEPTHRRAPALVYSWVLLAAAIIGGATFWFARLPGTSQNLGIFLLVIACICAFAAAGMVFASLAALFGLMD
jgi:hypothetical protein